MRFRHLNSPRCVVATEILLLQHFVRECSFKRAVVASQFFTALNVARRDIQILVDIAVRPANDIRVVTVVEKSCVVTAENVILPIFLAGIAVFEEISAGGFRDLFQLLARNCLVKPFSEFPHRSAFGDILIGKQADTVDGA